MSTQLKFILLVFAVASFTSFKINNHGECSQSEAGTFKVEVLYPAGEDKTFDMDYYEKKHMPMVARHLGKNLRYYEIVKGIGGRTPNDKAPFVAIGTFYIADVAEYGKAIAQNREEILGDIKNYTNIVPVVQVSEIKQVVYNADKNQ
ncbi:EthD family reductase [Ferruginibacter sp.]